MSTPLAIAAVTATLQKLLDTGLNANAQVAEVTTLPPDKARSGNHADNQVNLFLYQAMLNAAWRNRDIPNVVRPGSVGQPPLPLNLYYIITAYGVNDDDTNSHPLLGQAMSILHDHPLLKSSEIEAVLPASELQSQIEHVRITQLPLSLDEMSKLWFMFQTQYRLSAAYEAAVVLIDSTRPITTSLPVLKRNIIVKPFRQPAIDSVLPEPPEVITPGKQLTIKGQNLKGDLVKVSFGKALVNPDTVNAKQILVTLPGNLPAGIQGVQVVHNFNFNFPLDPTTNLDDVAKPPKPLPSDPHDGFESNIMPFVLSPIIDKDNNGKYKITVSPPAVNPLNPNLPPGMNPDGTHNATVTVTMKPEIGKTQRVVLLLNELSSNGTPHAYSFNAPPRDTNDPGPFPDVTIPIKEVVPGDYLVRIQVDGAESPLKVDTDKNQFSDPKVTI